ncbi:hypothetical protein C8J57DRAFT_1254074 [Mycena rebaudengoi]|nr:hypothetical protein C8J57DRAFT_1254074 [Mycena rebaudengoi]
MQSNTCSYFFKCAEVGRHPTQPFSKIDDGGNGEGHIIPVNKGFFYGAPVVPAKNTPPLILYTAEVADIPGGDGGGGSGPTWSRPRPAWIGLGCRSSPPIGLAAASPFDGLPSVCKVGPHSQIPADGSVTIVADPGLAKSRSLTVEIRSRIAPSRSGGYWFETPEVYN